MIEHCWFSSSFLLEQQEIPASFNAVSTKQYICWISRQNRCFGDHCGIVSILNFPTHKSSQ